MTPPAADTSSSEITSGPGPKFKSVQPRRVPRQHRSEQRLREILDLTAQLLELVGPDKLTTNLVARELGVSVGTLYHYYPNKQAVLHALAVRWLDEWQVAFDQLDVLTGRGIPAHQFVDEYVRRLLPVYRNQRGVLHLVQMMFTIPELRELDTRQDDRAVERLAGMFGSLGMRGPARERRRVGRVFLKLANTLLLEVVRQGGATAQRTLDDLRALLLLELQRAGPVAGGN